MKISEHALEAARACCNYCTTRFPTDTPPHQMLDVPWFAEKTQIAIDKATQSLRQEIDSLLKELHERRSCSECETCFKH